MDSYSKGYIIVTDYLTPGTGEDVSDIIQNLIDSNPNRTIYFPDGVYTIAKPILTPAHPKKSVDLRLSNFACIKASEDWTSDEAMIRLGAKDAANDINTPGSNYGFTGGIIDASGKAKAISIDGGRETRITEVSIKNAEIGIHIKHGANSGSSDADIRDVNITGNNSLSSIGLLIEGYDNTATNMRIASVFTGVEVRSGGNMLRNIHPLYIIHPNHYDNYAESVGFRVCHGMNWFDYCYSDQFARGFDTDGGGILKNCFCWWYSDREDTHIGIRSRTPFYGSIDTLTLGGAYHPEHPIRLSDREDLLRDGDIRGVVLVAGGRPERLI